MKTYSKKIFISVIITALFAILSSANPSISQAESNNLSKGNRHLAVISEEVKQQLELIDAGTPPLPDPVQEVRLSKLSPEPISSPSTSLFKKFTNILVASFVGGVTNQTANILSSVTGFLSEIFTNKSSVPETIIPIKQSDSSSSRNEVAIETNEETPSFSDEDSVSSANTQSSSSRSSVVVNTDNRTNNQTESSQPSVRQTVPSITRSEVVELIKESDINQQTLMNALIDASQEKSLSVSQSISSLEKKINSIDQRDSRQLDHVYNSVSRSFDDITALDGVTMTNSSFSGTTGTFTGLLTGTTGTFSGLLTLNANLLMSASAYLNFGTTEGTSGYGFRDNGGTIQVKNSAGSWSNIPTSGTTQWTTNGNDIYYTTGNIGIGTTTPNWKLSVSGIGSFDNYARASYFTATSTTASTFPYASTTAITATTASTTNLIVSNNSTLGTVISGVWNGTPIGDTYLTKSGDWTGTLDTYNGSDLLARTNHTGTQGVSTLSNYDWTFSNNYGTNNLTGSTTMPIWAQGGLNASSTSHFVYASTTALTVSGNSYLGTISSGTWNGTSIGNSYIDDDITLTNFTQITNRAISDTTGTLTVARGGTGQTSFGQGWLHSDGTTFTASTSPTVAWLTATSTTATSTFATGGLTVGTNQFVVQQNSGNVGIGTINPNNKLSISGNSSDKVSVKIDNTSSVASTTEIALGANSVASAWTLTSDIERNGTDSLAIWGGGSGATRFYINSSGNIGIGTTSPYAKLSVAGKGVFDDNVRTSYFTATSTTATSTFAWGLQANALNITSTSATSTFARGIDLAGGCFAVNGTCVGSGGGGSGTVNSGTTGQLAYYAGDGTSLTATSSLFIAPNQNIGIGTTSPYSVLSISNSVNTAVNTPLLTIASTTAGTATSTLFTILASGNVGIGTNAPTNPLHVYSSNATGMLFERSSASNSTIQYKNTAGSMYAGVSGLANFAINSAADLSTSALFTVVRTSGNVGIGTTTPNSKLTVFNSAADSAIEFSSASGNTYKWTMGMDYSDAGKFKIASSTALGTIDRFTIDGNGYVGIGTSTPAARLDVVDVSNAQLRLSQGTTVYTDFSVAPSTGDLTLSLYPAATADDILLTTANSTGANLWVCENSTCPQGISFSGGGNLFVEGGIKYATSSTPKTRRSIILTASGAVVPAISGAAKTQTNGTNHSYYTLDFDASSDESAFWQWTMPDSYDNGPVDVTYYWEAGATSGDVNLCFQAKGLSVNSAEDIDSSLSSAVCEVDTAQANANDLASMTEINATSNFTAGEYVTFKVFRDADVGADTMAGDANLVKVKIEYGVATESD